MIHIPEDEAARALTPELAHDEVRRVLSLWGSELLSAPPRVRGRAAGRGLNVLGGLVADEAGGIWAGTKMYSVDDGVGRGHTVLVSSPEGQLYTVGATELGALRTGAISGVATETMHGVPARIGLIGAGYQAERQARALLVLNPAAPIRVWNRTLANAEALAGRLRADGADAIAVDTLDEATNAADTVTVLTRAHEPLLHLRHIEAGAHVNAAGSNSLDRREVAEDLVEASRIVVDSIEQAEQECGDLLPSLDSGAISWTEVSELGDLVRSPRQADGRRTLFESQGMGVLDVALAACAVRLVMRDGGTAQ